MDKKELISEIESTYSFVSTIFIAITVAWGLYSDVTSNNFGTGTPELKSYMMFVYLSLSYFLFKICGKEYLSEKPLLWLKNLLVYSILFLTLILAFFASYDYKSIIIVLSALISFPAIGAILFLIFTPYLYEYYLKKRGKINLARFVQ